MSGIRILAIVVAAVVYFFARRDLVQAVLGRPGSRASARRWPSSRRRTRVARPYIVGFASVLVACCTLAWLIARTGATGWAGGAKLGVVLALGIVGAQLALNYGFEARSVSLWLINTGYAVVGLGIAGAIIGALVETAGR